MQLQPYLTHRNATILIEDAGALAWKVEGVTVHASIEGISSQCRDGLYYEVIPQEGSGELLGLAEGKRVYLKLKLAAGVRRATDATRTEFMDVVHGTNTWSNMVSCDPGVRSFKITILLRSLDFGVSNTKIVLENVTFTGSFALSDTVSALEIEGTVYGACLRMAA